MAITYAVGQRWTAALAQQLADYTVNRPVIRLVATSAQSINDNTNTAINFGTSSELIDTNDFHSESVNTSRITPTVAGLYYVRGYYITSSRSDYGNVNAWVRENGSTNHAPAHRYATATTSGQQSAFGTAIVDMNGSTDYVELAVLQDNTANVAANTNQSSQFSCSLEMWLLRPA